MSKRLLISFVCVGFFTAVTGRPAYPQAAAEWTASELERGCVVFRYNTLENLPAEYVPARDAVTNRISCAMARGEYESIQFGVCALDDGLANIRVTVTSDIPATVYHRIDPEIKAKLGTEPVTIPTWMDSVVYLQRGEVVAGLEKGKCVNFWLTFRADARTSPGAHAGRIRVQAGGRPAAELDLSVLVRAFELEAPRAAFGMYYDENRLPRRFGGWVVSDPIEVALFRDMAAHGMNSLSFSVAGDFSQIPPAASPGTLPLGRRVALAREAGLARPESPCLLIQHNIVSDYTPGGLSEAQLKAAAAWLQSEHREQGWPEMIAYGWDEPAYPAHGLRETYGPLRPLTIRLGTAMNATGGYAFGDVHDVWIVMGGEITAEMQAEAGRLGAQVWTYSYRILREGYSPLRQRFYAGLYTWAHALGGNYVWAYSDGHHSHAWWLPEGLEPMPLTGWEGRREGVDDYRYLQTLESAAKARGTDPAAARAAAWLAELRERVLTTDPHKADPGKPLAIEEYEAIRAAASDFIQKLGPAQPERAGLEPVKTLKDEAASFRGASADTCRDALRSPDFSTRRAAASALFEMGPKAAPAVPELTQALADPRVRIPALRALEAIGGDAFPAGPEIEALLSHPDSFVRLAGTYALAGIARPRTWTDDLAGYDPEDASPGAQAVVAPLVKALGDADVPIVSAAASGLFRCGKAAAPALPEALRLFGGKDASEAGMQILCAIGPGAVSAVPALVKRYADAKGCDPYAAQTLAAIGPAASEAVPVLEQYCTKENAYMASTCYALFCIRGDGKDLAALAGLVGDKPLPYGVQEWYSAARFLGALGGKAATVAPQVRERLPLLDGEPTLKRQIETVFLKRAADGAPPLRLLPR